ncbi:hypothetical protein [Nocardioides sp. Soil805]|uniref:hypothetical protein n=1 Tax=Nocardioides sp. Soil805 TaxID=1736416 RepID=UPI0012E37843|nr:hypothetical protein [Nocardioides sp. Soil805]
MKLDDVCSVPPVVEPSRLRTGDTEFGSSQVCSWSRKKYVVGVPPLVRDCRLMKVSTQPSVYCHTAETPDCLVAADAGDADPVRNTAQRDGGRHHGPDKAAVRGGCGQMGLRDMPHVHSFVTTS